MCTVLPFSLSFSTIITVTAMRWRSSVERVKFIYTGTHTAYIFFVSLCVCVSLYSFTQIHAQWWRNSTFFCSFLRQFCCFWRIFHNVFTQRWKFLLNSMNFPFSVRLARFFSQNFTIFASKNTNFHFLCFDFYFAFAYESKIDDLGVLASHIELT